MNIRSKIFLVSISTVIILSVAGILVWACGPMLQPDESRFQIFRPGIASDNGLEPFYYTERYLNSYWPDPSKDYLQNCNEWIVFSKNKVAAADVYGIQYATTPDSFLTAYNSKKWDTFKGNSFIQWLLKKSNREALHYMAFAKYVEYDAYDRKVSDPWNVYGDDRRHIFDSLATVAYKQCQTKLSDFLKERYAFQAVKLWYYASDSGTYNPQLFQAYDTYLKGKHTIVSAWGLLYYAMAQPQASERTHYLLATFDRSDEKKVFVYSHLSAAEVTAFEKVNTDTSLVPVIYTMKALKNPGKALTEIQDVYRYAPESKYLPLLVSREVNKLEDWLMSPEVLGFSSTLKENNYYRLAAQTNDTMGYTAYAQKNWAKDKAYLRDVRRTLQSMLESGYKEKNFARLAIAHLLHMEGNYVEARSYLNEIYAPNEKAWQIQLEIERIISLVHLNDINTLETREQIYSGIKRLEALGLTTQGEEYEDETKDDLSELLVLLSQEYRQKGDIVTAGLLYQKANIVTNEYDGYKADSGFSYGQIAYFDRYATPATMDSLLAFKVKTGKTEFEQYITPRHWPEEEYYLDLKGTILIREKKYEAALDAFNDIYDDFWAKNYAFADYLPENSILNVGTLVPGESGPTTKYAYPSKKLILQDIIKLQKNLDAASDPARKANIYFQLGNAYYNISFYGKGWMLFSYGNSQHELYHYSEDSRIGDWAFFSFYPNSIKYGTSYYKLSDAMNMYYRAYNYATGNRELAAKSLLMLAYCDHLANRDPYSYDEKKYYSKYLQQLSTRYNASQTFRTAISTCPDVRNFVNGK